MSGKIRNPTRRCKICGAECSKRMRYCVACAIQRKAARVGIDPRKVHVGVVRPPCTKNSGIFQTTEYTETKGEA